MVRGFLGWLAGGPLDVTLSTFCRAALRWLAVVRWLDLCLLRLLRIVFRTRHFGLLTYATTALVGALLLVALFRAVFYF